MTDNHEKFQDSGAGFAPVTKNNTYVVLSQNLITNGAYRRNLIISKIGSPLARKGETFKTMLVKIKAFFNLKTFDF